MGIIGRSGSDRIQSKILGKDMAEFLDESAQMSSRMPADLLSLVRNRLI